jgi:integrase/recombinase XerD
MEMAMNFLKDFIADGKIQGWTERSIECYYYHIKSYLEVIGKDPRNIDTEDLRKILLFLDERKLSNSTVEKYFAALSSFYRFLEYEEEISQNPIPRFRNRYLKSRMKNKNNGAKRQLITIEQMRELINSILNPRDKAVSIMLCKTGVRLSELVNIDIDDVNWTEQSIKLKPNGKRSNLTVFFDDESGRILKRYVSVRDDLAQANEKALFINYYGERMKRRGIEIMISKYAQRLNLHDPASTDLGRRFTPHCCRHWYTTHLRRAGMPREHIKELRGDSKTETMDVYMHIDEKELMESYLAYIPQLGI